MSFGIERQSDQYGAFQADPGIYATRDRVAVYDVPDGVPEYLVSPGITAGLNNPRQAAGYDGRDPAGNPRDLYGDGHDYEGAAREDQGYFDAEHGFDREPPFDPGADNPHRPLPVQPLDQFQEQHHPDDFSHYHNAEPPPSFRSARSGGPDRASTPANPSTKEALAVPPAQPAPPAAPVWLGHTYAPGHRVGLPWRGEMIPGTVTHLDGYNVGVRYDDGQHATEEPSAIQPLHKWN